MPPTITSELQPRREGGIRCSVLFGDFVDVRLGDCMDVMREYPDKYFDLAIADPPYGLGQDGHAGSVRVSDGKQLRRVFEQKEWDRQIPPAEYFVELRRVSKNQIILGGNYMTAHLPPSRCWVTWDKVQRDLCMADGESAWTSFDEPSRIWSRHRKVLWDEKPIHPTQKPVALYKWLLSKWAKPGHRILDTHLGSGSIALACHDMKLSLVACEIDADYFKAACDRIERGTAQGDWYSPNGQAHTRRDTMTIESPETCGSAVVCSDLLAAGRPYYQDEWVTLYNRDASEIADTLPPVELVLTDPPYPNSAGHFDDGIHAALRFLETYRCGHWMIFWHELETPPLNLPLVAKHVWHRNNSNRPDNYEPCYEFHADGKKRASRVLPYPVIYPGLTGCEEATGHPTQKNLKLMQRLIHMADAKTILDPFCGSGTTIEAAKLMRLKVIGVEKSERWCEVTARRCAQDTLALGS